MCRTASALLLWLGFAAGSWGDDLRQPWIVAHRGLLLEAPENTLANFNACWTLGLGWELDVRRSRDGHLVVIHDATVDRTTDGTGRVDQLTLQQLQSLDAGSWFDERFRKQRIPTLDEVFAALARQRDRPLLVAVDLKGDDLRIEADVVRLANQHQVLPRLLMIGRAVDHADVRRRLRQADSATPAACVANSADEFPDALQAPDADWVYVRYVPTRQEVARVHEAGKRVFIAGPTVAGRQSANWRRAAELGVDAILTDYSLELARLLRRRASSWRQLEPHFTPPAEYREDLGPYRSPLIFADGQRVETPQQWQQRRAEILQQWHAMMGPWPPLLKEPQIKRIKTERRGQVTQHQVHVEVYPGGQYAEGHLLVPDGDGPFPAVLVPFYESATSVGLGPRGKGTHDYGWQLARRGFVTLSIGTPGSIEQPGGSTRELLTAAGERQQRQPLSYLTYVAANCHTALARMPQVDGERIGIVGLSYGGKWSMFASCLYDKFACAVWSDPGIVFNEKNANVNYWEPWYLGWEEGVRRQPGVPNDQRPRTGLYRQLVESGRDLNELHALICPRPVLVAGGTEDPPENWRALNHLLQVNQLLGHDHRVAMTHRKTHVPTPEALEQTLLFLEYFLKE